MMRLIDADALMERAERQCDLGCEYPKSYKDAMCRACPAGYVKDLIEDAPTVDAEPVRHGRWKETTERLGWRDVSCAECSLCVASFVLDELSIDEHRAMFLFCPNCGAKMDKEDEND